MYKTVVDERITVTSQTPGDEEGFNRLRDRAPYNILNWVRPEHRRGVTRRRGGGRRSGALDGVVWAPREIIVEALATAFEFCEFGNGYWVAVGKAPGADITIESEGVPHDAVVLERHAEPKGAATLRR